MFIPLTLQDYAYLAWNVYHEKEGILKYVIPGPVHETKKLDAATRFFYDDWYHISTPLVAFPLDSDFYAELYVKAFQQGIQHIMIAVRGTVPGNFSNYEEDTKVWWKAVLENSYAVLNDPDYMGGLYAFRAHAEQVIHQLHDLGLVSADCQYHATGHSLGGALVNLMAASALHYYPYTTMPLQVVSFNAPGIGTMPDVLKDTIHEEFVINMRAHYDFISAVGQPYGYVINNHIPEGYKLAQAAFAQTALLEVLKQDPFQVQILSDIRNVVVKELIAVETTASIFAQHSMDNFFAAVMHDHEVANFTFYDLQRWADEHGAFSYGKITGELIPG